MRAPGTSGVEASPWRAEAGPGLDRRGFVATAAAALAAAALGRAWPAAAAAAPPPASYRSRPDLQPPRVAVTHGAVHEDARIFVAPLAGPGQYGPLVLDARAEPLWFRPLPAGTIATSFSAQTYRGERVLTWWEGQANAYGWGEGEYVIVDQRYGEVARVRAGHGLDGDLHEFVLTSKGTALFTVYDLVAADLTAVGGPADGQVVDAVVQEVDVRTGAVVFEWHSRDHVELTESYRTYPTTAGTTVFDYVHPNAVCETSDGNLLLSGRHTCALYKLDRDTGRVIWRLGGRRSDFTIGAGASFAYQHHVRTHGASRITLFDNASYGGAPTEPTSRVLDLHVDERGRRVSLRRAFAPPGGGISRKMGSAELMPDGGMFVGWSDLPLLTEYAPDGTLRFSASFAASGYSYRALRGPWEGRPRTLPDVAVERAPGGDLVAYASWNGATDVATWRIDGGAHARALTALKQVPRAGFETAVPLQGAPTVVVAHALDATGARLASSRPTLVAA